MNASPAPQVFIASASEGLSLANCLRDCLGEAGLSVRVWNEGTFKLSQTFIESLENELNQVDFAVLTLTPDDTIQSRGKTRKGPRDNIIFELGLFMGRLGRDRSYFVFDKACDPKLPSDLQGVVPASYVRRGRASLPQSVASICEQMAKRMRALGPRAKMNTEEEAEWENLGRFCERVAGVWYQKMLSRDRIRLTILRITSGLGLHTFNMEGESFDANGRQIARWRSTATGIRVSDRTLIYSWEGEHPTRAHGISSSGFGQFKFTQSSNAYTTGVGTFADIHAGKKVKDAVRWKGVEIRRVASRDIERVERVFRESSDAEKAAFVKQIMSKL